MEEALKDERFNHILNDPRFRKIPRNVSKIKVDKRFKDMFKDKKFKAKGSVDKRGRQLNLTSSENLKKLYNITSESSSEDEESGSNKPQKQEINKKINSMTENNSNDDENQKNIEKLNSSGDETSINFNKSIKKKKNKKLKDASSLVSAQEELSKKTDEPQSEKSIISKSDENIANLKELKNKEKSIKKSNHKSVESLEHSQAFKKDERFQLHAFSSSDVDDSHMHSNCSSLKKNIHHSSLKLQKNVEDKEIGSKISLNDDRISNSSNEDSDADSNDEGATESSEDSSDADSESDDVDKNEDFDHRWEELNEDAPDADQITRRLAVCNMDWDRIRAVDLMTVFSSFKPADGCINSVKIYPSEYGLKRMEEERLHGPPELVEKVLGSDEEEKEDKKGQRYNREKLRQYQINRLKYYYAVIETDSPETANSLYEELHGMEYESCSVRFDLRFIPDDVTFDQEPTSVEDKVPDPTEYKPRLFVTTALQQVKVNLTWDETDPKRRETLQKAFTEPDTIEKDIKDYLASSSEESEDENENIEDNEKLSTNDRIAKYKALLQSLEEKEKNEEEKYEMEITWDPGLKEKTEEIVKERLDKDNLNPFDEMLKKKKEKMKLRRKEKKIDDEVSSDEDDESLSGGKNSKNDSEDNKALAELALMSDARKIDLASNKKKKRNKNKIKKENLDDFQCDVKDPRFSAIYSSHLYNIDPSDPHFKSTPGNMALLQEKQKKFKHAGTDFVIKNAKKAKHK